MTSLTRSRDQARQAYEGGVLALIDVLDADRALLDASDRLAASRAEAARASVAAVRALGGGMTAASTSGPIDKDVTRACILDEAACAWREAQPDRPFILRRAAPDNRLRLPLPGLSAETQRLPPVSRAL